MYKKGSILSKLVQKPPHNMATASVKLLCYAVYSFLNEKLPVQLGADPEVLINLYV